MLKVIRAYVLQMGCICEEKKAFRLDLNETVEKIPMNERIVVEADLNGHVIKRITMIRNVWVTWNGEEKQRRTVADFRSRMELLCMNCSQ